MRCSKASVLLVLGSLAFANAFNTLVPWDKELIYQYQALVKAGTHVPASYASQFILQGNLHIQANNNATHVKLTDLTYRVYNGVLNHVDEHVHHEQVPVPQELHDLHKVFKIVYDEHGKTVGIATDEHEKEYTRNIKKAIAAILQLDVGQVLKETHHPHAFVVDELSVHGPSSVHYTVLPHEQWLEVHKVHEVVPVMKMYHHTIQNIDLLSCQAPFEEPVAYDSQRKYVIHKKDGHHVVDHIEANGGVYYAPFQGQSEAQYIFVNQTFDLVHAVPIKEQFHVQAQHYQQYLAQHFFDHHVDVEVPYDISNGRRHVNVQQFQTLVHKLLEDIYNYLHRDHIHTGTPNMEYGQLINRLEILLVHLDYNALLNIHNNIKQTHPEHHEKIHEIYHQMLPLVGTKGSVVLIKHLISNHLVSSTVAIEMLQEFPRHVKLPNRHLVTELEDILQWGDKIEWNVRKVAIIAFGNLVHHAYLHEKKAHENHHIEHAFHLVHEHNVHHHHNHWEDDVDDYSHHYESPVQKVDIDGYYEKYVTVYVNKLKQSTQYQHHVAYFGGLTNMKLHSVYTHLLPAIQGEWWSDHHHRLMAMWAVYPVVLQHPEEVFKTFWPIFVNPHEHTELRISAYYIIMDSDIKTSTLLNIYWYMQHEQNHEVYNFYYTHIRSLAHTTDPCKSVLQVHAAQILAYMQPSTHGLSSYHQIDYVDPKYGFGNGIHGLFIHTNTSFIVGGYMTSQVFHHNIEEHQLFVKVHGLEQVGNIFKINTQHTEGLFNFEEVAKVLFGIKDNHDVHIELSHMKHGELINSWYIDSSNMHEIHSIFELFVEKPLHKDIVQITYGRYIQVIMPTDIGFPSIWTMVSPMVHKNLINFSKEVINNVFNLHIDNQYSLWSHSRHGLAFYNPILDVYQGIHKIHAFDISVPLYFDVSVNIPQKSLKISSKIHQDAHKDVLGLRSHVQSVVFFHDVSKRNILTHSPNHVLVSYGEQEQHVNDVHVHLPHRQNYTILDEDNLNIGRHWQVVAYDFDHHVSNGTFSHAKHVFTHGFHKNFETPLGHYILSGLHWLHYIIYQPQPGVHGLLVRIEPTTEYHVTNVDLSLRWNYEVHNEGYVYTPGLKFNTRATYSLKNQEKVLKTWDVNTIVDFNPGHTVNNLKVHLTRIIPGQKDYKVCVEGLKKYSHEGVTGHLNIAMSQSADGKCVTDDTVIDVTMVGEKSHEQIQLHHPYGACQYTVPYSVEHFHTINCLQAHTSIRKFVYNVKTTNVPVEFKKHFLHFWEVLKGHHQAYYNYEEEHNVNVGEYNAKVKVVYPMDGHTVDVNIYTPQHWYSLTGVPTHQLQWYGVEPDTHTYSKGFVNLHELGLVDHCLVHNDSLYWEHHHYDHHVGRDWSVYVADVVQNPKYAVYVKQNDHHELAVKIVDHSHVLEIHPEGTYNKIVVDGKEVDKNNVHYHQDWVSYHVFHEEATAPIAIVLPHSGLHLEYYRNHVQVVLPKVDHHWHGHCTHH